MVSRVDQNTTSSTGGSRAGSVVNATLIQLPIAPVYDENGDYANYQGYPADGMNPVEYLHKVKSGFLSDRTRTTLGLLMDFPSIFQAISPMLRRGMTHTCLLRTVQIPGQPLSLLQRPRISRRTGP